MDPKLRNWLALGVIAVLVAVAWWQFWPPNTEITQGLDIKGGLSVILTAEPAPNQQLSEDAMSRAETILTNRVNTLGVSEASVQRQGADSFLVQLPGVQDAEAALAALGSTGQLEFVEVSTIEDTAAVSALQVGTENVELEEGTYEPFLTGDVITDAAAGIDQNTNQAVVNLDMNSEGADIWREVTTRLTPTRGLVAIVLDGVVVSAPAVQEPIPNGQTQISGNFDAESAKRLAGILESGALPVSLTFSESRVVGPTLGQDSLAQGLIAGLVGLGLVAVFMGLYYRGLGVVSWFSLSIFASLFLGVLAVLSKVGAFALSLPGIAGIVLTIGLAADSSILQFERFKEEVRLGKTFRSAAKSGTRHAIGTSLDADVVTFVSALMIYLFAIGPVRGFALTLMIGMAIDIVVMTLFTSSAIRVLAETVVPKAPFLFGMKGGDRDA